MMKMVWAVLIVLCISFPAMAYAMQFGKWEVQKVDYHIDSAPKTELFDVCINQDKSWYISGDEQAWKGKWHENIAGSDKQSQFIILQAIHAQAGSMRSISADLFGSASEVSADYIELTAASGKMTKSSVELSYKGANCASPQVPAPIAQARMKPSGQKNTYETKEKEPIGPWRVVALYKNGVFDSCGAILNGEAGELVMSRGANPKEDFDRLHISPVTGNQSASPLKARIAFNQEDAFDIDAVIDAEISTMVIDVHEGLASSIYGYGDLEGYGEIRNSRDLHVWVNGEKKTWNLSHTFYVSDVLDICVNEEVYPKKAPVEMWTDRFSLPQVVGPLKNEFTGQAKCLKLNQNGQVSLEQCGGANSIWKPTISNQPGYYSLRTLS